MTDIWHYLKKNQFIDDECDTDSKDFAIRVFENNLEYINQNYNKIRNYNIIHKCFLIACTFSNNKNILEFMINHFKIEINYFDIFGHDSMSRVCANSNTDVFNFVINLTNISVRSKHFIDACSKNQSLSIIKCLAEDNRIDVNYKTNEGIDCVIASLMNNNNLEIIKYLFENERINKTVFYFDDHLQTACHHNKNLLVIKFLISKMDKDHDIFNPNHNYYSCYCLKKASISNNIDIVKYLINELKINIKCNCKIFCDYVLGSCRKNDNQVAKYLISCNDVKLSTCCYDVKHSIIILKEINNYNRFNEFIMMYGYLFQADLKKYINPLMLNYTNRQKLKIKDPFYDDFDKFIKYVNGISCKIPCKIKSKCKDNNNFNLYDENNIPLDLDDDNTLKDILFKHNNKIYYGNRQIVYGTMYLFSDESNQQYFDLSFDNVFELSVCVAEYIIDIYIRSCYTKTFSMEQIKSCDFQKFLNLIDQYPTKVLSINSLEHDIILYIDKHLILFDDIKGWNLFEKYKMKYMHLFLQRKMDIIIDHSLSLVSI